MKFSSSMRVVAPLLVAALTACSGSTSGMIVDLGTVEAGDDCANGGLMIQTGVDANEDGILQADEVSSSEFVCDGESGESGEPGEPGEPAAAAALLRQTGLDQGDANCPFGGTQFDAGIDDGDPSGTANDGILQDGEIDSTEYVCSGNPGAGLNYVPIVEPDGAGGTSILSAAGGEGLVEQGGDAGYVQMGMDYGSNGGGIHVYATGEADADWIYPSSIAINLGDNPLEITADLALAVVSDTTTLSDGELYINSESDEIQMWTTADGAGDAYTGVHIGPGATLTLSPASPSTRVQLDMDWDFHLEGTVTTSIVNGWRAGLSITPFNFIGAATGAVELSGPAIQPDRRGEPLPSSGSGGNFSVRSDDSWFDFEESAGSIWNQASINTSGGSGVSGGDAGDIRLDANWLCLNTGELTAVGGSATSGQAGNGGDIEIESDYSHTMNSGTANGSGGDSANGDGGDGGDIDLYNGYFGEVRNTADFIANGGDASCAGGCVGGTGGTINLDVYANPLWSSGDLLARGGSGTTLNGTRGLAVARGGDGGRINTSASYESGYFEADYVAVGDFAFSGNWDTSGGDGAAGGSGGEIDVALDAEYVPNQQVIRFYGYGSVDVSGGDGAEAAGSGGYFKIYTENYESDYYPSYYGPGGSVANFADVNVSGGDSLNADGGDAGYVDLYTDSAYSFDAEWQVVVNRGDIDAHGGDAVTSARRGPEPFGTGGDGGAVFLYGVFGADNSGDINANGGTGSNGGCGGCSDYGEWDYGVYIVSDIGRVVNTGDISLRGGDALNPTGFAGDSEVVEIVGWQVTSSGSIDASGGDADLTGGEGGSQTEGVNILSLYGVTDFTGAFIDVGAGQAGEPGSAGFALIDGQNVTEDYAPVTPTR
ncbi:MAG: hypothetical protein ACI855_004631 [Myxococcota bacterium]|jgi:hypothetical protein